MGLSSEISKGKHYARLSWVKVMRFQSGAGSHSLLFVSPFVSLYSFSILLALPICSFFTIVYYICSVV